MTGQPEDLRDLSRRLDQAKGTGGGGPATGPDGKGPAIGQGTMGRGLSFAMRVAVELAAALAVGIGIGWWLDSTFGTKPVWLTVFLVLGFAAGVLNVFRAAEEYRRRAEAEAKTQGK